MAEPEQAAERLGAELDRADGIGDVGVACDSQRMKNAMTTIEAQPMRVTTKCVVRLRRRALATAIRIAVKPTR